MIDLAISLTPIHSTGSTFWSVVVAGAVVGILIIALQQFYWQIIHRKTRVAEARLLETISQQLDMDEAISDLLRYQKLSAELRSAVAQVPGQAASIYLREKRDRLAENIIRDYYEYQSIERALKDFIPRTDFERKMMELIELSVVSSDQIQRRRNFWITTLAIFLALLSISPVDTHGMIDTYFRLLDNTGETSPSSIGRAVAAGASCVIIMLVIGIPLLPYKPIIERGRTLISQRLALAAASLTAMVLILSGYGLRLGAAHSVTASQLKKNISAYNDLAGIIFNIAVLVLSFAVAGWLLLWRSSLQRHRTKTLLESS